MTTQKVSLAMVNANVLTMETGVPLAEAVAISGKRIVAVGSNAEIRNLASPRTSVIDCQGRTLLPGFNDAHIHLPGLARRLRDLDCSPRHAPSVAALQSLIREGASTLPSGSWVRGFGYDDLRLAERRHPDRRELDAASSRHPVWLQHRSGHASVLNSLALEAAAIHRETPDPPGGVIERDELTGEPTGVMLECESFLRQRLGRIRGAEEFDDGMREAGLLLASYGVTSVQDAGADNGIERWETFRRLQSDGALPCRITMFAGIRRLEELADAALSYGSGDDTLRLRHAKIVLTLTSGRLHPSIDELKKMIVDAHRMGFPVAIHCIEEDAIATAAAMLAANKNSLAKSHPQPTPPSEGEGIIAYDRIEHCAEGMPELIDAVSRSGAAVVTNPGFVYHNGMSYRENVGPRLLPHLYPAGGLVRAGVATAFGSDAPVIDPNPWPAIYSAVTRRASDGKPLADADQQAVSVEQALRMYTLEAAKSEAMNGEKGSIGPGKLADLALVESNPLTVDAENLPGIKTVLTVIGGSVVWENS